MAIASSVIRRAMRLCGIIDAAEAVPADQMQDAIETLNALLAEWHVAGIGLPDYSVTGPTDTLAFDAADSEAVSYQLAIRLAPEYSAQLSALTLSSAAEAMNRLRLRYFVPGTIDLSELPSPYLGFNIEIGD